MYYLDGIIRVNKSPIICGAEFGDKNKKGENIKMRRNLKKLGCAILCTCLLLINTPGAVSYAENTEQYATYTDANTTTEDVDVPEGAYSIEINSQADWDNLFTYMAGDGSGWTNSGGTTTYIEDKNPVAIIINADITLSQDIVLSIPPIDSVQKDFLLYGDGQHSIDLDGHAFKIQAANTVAIDNAHINNGMVQVYGHINFSCTDSQFSAASVELYTANAGVNEITNITGCEFFDCPGPCIYSSNAPCPVSFSDCYMNNSGLLFKTKKMCPVSFSNITAEECTGTVFGQGMPDTESAPYIIKSISGCELSTSQPGITAIDQYGTAIGEITDCTITGFDTGIKLDRSNSVSGIDSIKINDIIITDCITGVHIEYLSGYKNAMISNLTMEAREGASNTVGFNGIGTWIATFDTVNYDFNKMPQIKSCHISGFDTGINLDSCEVVVSDCEISDCKKGISTKRRTVAIVDTTLEAGASATDSVGVTTNATNGTCYLIDCDINGFDIGSDMENSYTTTIIGCRYQNRDTNLIGGSYIACYDTSFIGGETSVIVNDYSYFYDCIVKGDAATTKSGFSTETSNIKLYIYSLNRPYDSPINAYDNLKKYSNRRNGKSEIFNCETGIDVKNAVYIADTYIHDCVTGIKSYRTESYGNNMIENCYDGMIVDNLYKYGTNTTFTNTHVDTIRNCSNDGLDGCYIVSSPREWNNRLEIHDCGNYGIMVNGSLAVTAVDVHDCRVGIYNTDNAGTIDLNPESMIYNNQTWNIFDNCANNSSFIIQGLDATLTGGELGNIYSKRQLIIDTEDLYSDDSVYYLGTEDVMFIFGVNNLYGMVVFDTVDSGYTLGRRVAKLTNPDIASQMFTNKEGYIISTEEEEKNGATTTYAIFAAGYDVTYDVTANGGDTFSDRKLSDEEINYGKLMRISYLTGSDVDLTYTASKTGYEFVGWNTDPNATEGLDALTADREDITLYAIYK